MSPLAELPPLPPPPPAIHRFADIAASLQASVERVQTVLVKTEEAVGKYPPGSQIFTKLMRERRHEWERFSAQVARELGEQRQAVDDIMRYAQAVESAGRTITAAHVEWFQMVAENRRLQAELDLKKLETATSRIALNQAYQTGHSVILRLCAVVTLPVAAAMLVKWLGY